MNSPFLKASCLIILVSYSVCLARATGGGGYLHECFPDFEDAYHIHRDPEFRGYKFLCKTEENLECQPFLYNNSTDSNGYVSYKLDNLEVWVNLSMISDESAQTNTSHPVWLCACPDNQTYINFGRSSYWKKAIEEAKAMFPEVDVMFMLDQSFTLKSKCVSRLEEACLSNDACPPNAQCVLSNNGNNYLCKCKDGYISVLDCCYQTSKSAATSEMVISEITTPSSGAKSKMVISDPTTLPSSSGTTSKMVVSEPTTIPSSGTTLVSPNATTEHLSTTRRGSGLREINYPGDVVDQINLTNGSRNYDGKYSFLLLDLSCWCVIMLTKYM